MELVLRNKIQLDPDPMFLFASKFLGHGCRLQLQCPKRDLHIAFFYWRSMEQNVRVREAKLGRGRSETEVPLLKKA
jgi:hypothetical protein